MDKDNRPELKSRLAADYKLLKDDPIVEAMMEAVAIAVDRGYMEMDPIAEKYSDLICPWCGKLHFRQGCQRQFEEYQQEHKATLESEE